MANCACLLASLPGLRLAAKSTWIAVLPVGRLAWPYRRPAAPSAGIAVLALPGQSGQSPAVLTVLSTSVRWERGDEGADVGEVSGGE